MRVVEKVPLCRFRMFLFFPWWQSKRVGISRGSRCACFELTTDWWNKKAAPRWAPNILTNWFHECLRSLSIYSMFLFPSSPLLFFSLFYLLPTPVKGTDRRKVRLCLLRQPPTRPVHFRRQLVSLPPPGKRTVMNACNNLGIFLFFKYVFRELVCCGV